MKRHSWEMKNFMPREEPEVPLLMSAVEERLSAGNARSSDDDELDQMCNDLLDDDDDDHPQLSPMPVIDKAVDDTSIVGMSHDIDDVVDSVINDDDFPPIAVLSELSVLPPAALPSKPLTAADTALLSDESRSSPKLSSNVPGLTYVNNDRAVLVRLRRLSLHRYRSQDVQQRVGVSGSSDCVESLNITSVPDAACKLTASTSDGASSSDNTSVKQEPTLSTSKPLQNGHCVSKLHKSVSKRGSSGEKSSTKKSVAHTSTGSLTDGSRQSPVVVLNALPAETVRSAQQVLCSKVVGEQSQSSKSSSSVKRKSTAVGDSHVVKKHCTESTSDSNKPRCRLIGELPKLCVKISILRHRRMWVRSFSTRLTSVTLAEDKVLIFLILRKSAKIVQL